MGGISDTVSEIRDNLRDGFWDEVTRGELQENSRLLNGLSPADTNSVVAELSDGELDKWIDELYDSNWLGLGEAGLTADERRDLFNNFARDLDAGQLDRVYQSLGSESRQAELLDAIGRHGSDAVKVALVERLASRTTDQPYDFNAGWASSSSTHWDADAVAVGRLLTSINTQSAFSQALGSLSHDQLDAVMQAGIRETTTSYYQSNGIPSTAFDTTELVDLIATTSRFGTAEEKARVFELGSRLIRDIRAHDTLLSPTPSVDGHAGDISDVLSQLIDTDTNGIVTALERGADPRSDSPLAGLNTRNGNGMSTYLAELVRQQDYDQLHQLIARLQIGNSLPGNGDPLAFLSEFTLDREGNRNRQNASNLGYLLGGLREGIESISSDRQAQADMLATIFTTALGLIPGGNAASKAAITIARPLSSEFIDATADSLIDNDLQLAQAIADLIVPYEANVSDLEDTILSRAHEVQLN